MITLGIDFAAQDSNTAFCFIEWENDVAHVHEAGSGTSDDDLLKCFCRAEKVGIDIPFGWPNNFVEAVTAHHEGRPWPSLDRESLRYRTTDFVVKERIGRWPLSVSSDLIAVPTLRAAALFFKLAALGEAVDRTGRGRLVEVYPAGALAVWGFRSKGYKKAKGKENRFVLIDDLVARTAPCLKLSRTVHDACRRSDDVLDALVASLVARACARGLCEVVPEAVEGLAATEGWVALPRATTLDLLPDAWVPP